MSKYDDYNYEDKKYSELYKSLGYNVKRVDNKLIIDDRYVLQLANSHWKDLKTEDKGCGAYVLERHLKEKGRLIINIE